MASEKVRVRETVVSDELYDFILFMTHSFLRPTESEIYALTYRDITIADDPKMTSYSCQHTKIDLALGDEPDPGDCLQPAPSDRKQFVLIFFLVYEWVKAKKRSGIVLSLYSRCCWHEV